MKKIKNTKRKIPPHKKGIKGQLTEILNLGKRGLTKLKEIDDLLEAIAREIVRQLDRQAE